MDYSHRPLKERLAHAKDRIEKGWPAGTPELKLWLNGLLLLLDDAFINPKDRGDANKLKYNTHHYHSARALLQQDVIREAEICGVDSSWVKRVIAECNLPPLNA